MLADVFRTMVEDLAILVCAFRTMVEVLAILVNAG